MTATDPQVRPKEGVLATTAGRDLRAEDALKMAVARDRLSAGASKMAVDRARLREATARHREEVLTGEADPSDRETATAHPIIGTMERVIAMARRAMAIAVHTIRWARIPDLVALEDTTARCTRGCQRLIPR